MTKTGESIVGGLASVAFLWAGVAILAWDIGKLQQAQHSREWPRVEGTVTESHIDDREREHRPLVEYTYTVAGTPFTSRQISFDVFDKPGGVGRIESIVARYPVGRKVTVYHDPKKPATAVLEPGVYYPFIAPLMFGALFFCSGAIVFWIIIRRLMGEPPKPNPDMTLNRLTIATAFISVLICVVFVLVSFDPAVQETFVAAFGERPAGVPNIIFVLALQALLFLPMPWVFWHGMRLAFQARDDGRGLGIVYLLTVGRSHPHLRTSVRVCIGGLVYFVVLCAAWIAYTAARGI